MKDSDIRYLFEYLARHRKIDPDESRRALEQILIALRSPPEAEYSSLSQGKL